MKPPVQDRLLAFIYSRWYWPVMFAGTIAINGALVLYARWKGTL